MKRTPWLFSLVMIIAAPARSAPVDDAIITAMKVQEATSYRWTTTVDDDSRFYTIDGKLRSDGYTLVTMPMVSTLQRRLGANRSEIQTAIFKGDIDFVVETPEGWKTPDELS